MFNIFNIHKYNIKRGCIAIFLSFILCGYNNVTMAESKERPAGVNDPVQFLHSITDQVLTKIKNNKIRGSINSNVAEIINQIIMPNIDFDEMGQWIAGRSIWSKSSKQEQENFSKQLKQLLIKTYATTVSSYSEEKIEFQNYTGDLTAKRIQIKSTVIRTNKENLSVDYRLIAKEDSWKVYDLIIEGVSILQGFRAQFSDDIRQQGIVAVTNKIREHNKDVKL